MTLPIEVSSYVQPQLELKEPSFYQVLLHNDDYTPMEFVVDILMSIFDKKKTEAKIIMMDVHNKGIGLCGIYPYEIAETKLAQVHKEAQAHEYPLKCTIERLS